MNTALLHNECKNPDARLVLAHGAGAPMDHPFMEFFATELAKRRLHIIRFEFPYMAARRTDGKRRGPDRQPVLLECWRDVISQLGTDKLFIGGKSMGGRMASMVADEVSAAGLVCLGYPFHAPGKPEKLRVEHLKSLETPALIVQGERDTFGTRAEVEQYPLADAILLHFLADGDHSFKPRKASGRSEQQNWLEAIEAIAAFVADAS